MWSEDDFPNLNNTTWSLESDWTSEYNCIAYAADDTRNWWWPARGYYWPDGVPRRATLENFILAFQTLGYELADDDQLEPGFEKVAIYVDDYGRPTHAAKQTESGSWISKLGDFEDIEHGTLQGLEDSDYGHAVRYLKRPRYGDAVDDEEE